MNSTAGMQRAAAIDFARVGAQKLCTFLREASARSCQEDVDAPAWIYQNVTNDPAPFVEQSFAPDPPGLLMRRTLHRLATAELGAAPPDRALPPALPKADPQAGRYPGGYLP
jgi:hypothetical protein